MSLAENFIQICLGLAIGAMLCTAIFLHLLGNRLLYIEQMMQGTLMALVSEKDREKEVSKRAPGTISEFNESDL